MMMVMMLSGLFLFSKFRQGDQKEREKLGNQKNVFQVCGSSAPKYWNSPFNTYILRYKTEALASQMCLFN